MLLITFLLLVTLGINETYFFEPFDGDVIGSRWIVSKNERYNGTWAVESRISDVLNSQNPGLVTKVPLAFYGISTKVLFKAIEGEFVVQFESKIQETPFECGGSYIKILNEELNPEEFYDRSSYVILFGPDRCGGNNQFLFIYRTENPLSHVWTEHKLITKAKTTLDNVTHLYTLIIHEDDTFSLKIDNVEVEHGSLHDPDLFTPPFEPPKEIPDKNDVKPADWVDNAEIPDPTDVKPDDWDEEAPQFILDPKATKPEDWKEDEPLEIVDSTAVKPAEWNDEEDGEWKGPNIPNPYCVDHGCGTWEHPKIRNPEYKGKWKAKSIPNPEFKGVWKPKNIDNPYYFKPENLYKIGNVYGVAFDLNQATAYQWFDNIYIGTSAKNASEIADEHWTEVNKAEVALAKEQEETKNLSGSSKLLSNKTLIYGLVAVVVIALLITIIFTYKCCGKKKEKSKPEDDKAKEEKKDDEEKKEDDEKKEPEETKPSTISKEPSESQPAANESEGKSTITTTKTEEKVSQRTTQNEPEDTTNEDPASKKSNKKGKKKASHDE